MSVLIEKNLINAIIITHIGKQVLKIQHKSNMNISDVIDCSLNAYLIWG